MVIGWSIDLLSWWLVHCIGTHGGGRLGGWEGEKVQKMEGGGRGGNGFGWVVRARGKELYVHRAVVLNQKDMHFKRKAITERNMQNISGCQIDSAVHPP